MNTCAFDKKLVLDVKESELFIPHICLIGWFTLINRQNNIGDNSFLSSS